MLRSDEALARSKLKGMVRAAAASASAAVSAFAPHCRPCPCSSGSLLSYASLLLARDAWPGDRCCRAAAAAAVAAATVLATDRLPDVRQVTVDRDSALIARCTMGIRTLSELWPNGAPRVEVWRLSASS